MQRRVLVADDDAALVDVGLGTFVELDPPPPVPST
jgi:hypothetical protein